MFHAFHTVRRLLAVLAVAAIAQALKASESEGLFVEGNKPHTSELDLKRGEMVIRIPVVRLEVTRAVFRFDSESKSTQWLEIEINAEGALQNPDPGDFYIFRIDGKDIGGFSTRGQIEGGNWKWALGFKDVAAGRELLAKIGKVYGLEAGRVLDQTRETSPKSEGDSKKTEK